MIATPNLNHILGLCLSASLGMSCASTEESKETTTTTEPKAPTLSPEIPVVNEPVSTDAAATTLKAAIASVQLNQDCPDPASASATDPSPGNSASRRDEKAKRGKRGRRSSGFSQPCRQSSIQLAFTGQAEATSIEIKSLRLLSIDGKDLGQLSSRHPTMFSETGYVKWEEIIPANAELKASYKLSIPNWSDVDTALGAPSVGVQFTLEVELEANGKTIKLNSPSFGRTRPQMMRT